MHLYSLFPPPRYLSMPSFGLDISDRSMKYMSFKRGEKGVRLDKFGKKNMPEGMIQGGIIKKRDEMTAFLRDVREKIGVEYGVVGLPEEKAFLYVVQLPVMDLDKVEEAVEMQMEENVPLPVAETVFDYKVISRDAGVNHMDVVVAAYPRNIIEEYKNILNEAGIVPLAFEIEAESIMRAVIPRGAKETYLIVDFGKTRTSFVIVSGGDMRFTTTINVAGESLDSLIGKAAGLDMYGAEEAKRKLDNIFVSGKDDKIFSAIIASIDVIRNEAARSIDYWNTHAEHAHGKDSGAISKILLCGGDANLGGLTEYLSRSLKIKTELANVWINISSFEDYVPEITLNESLTYATAIGLGLRAFEI